MPDCKFLFITVNEIEENAFLCKLENQDPQNFENSTGVTFGNFGEKKTYVAHCNVQRGNKALRRIDNAIEAVKPQYTIYVGVACGGLNTTDKNIGDVLISEYVQSLDDCKIENGELILRDANQRCGLKLYDAFDFNSKIWNKQHNIPILKGTMLSFSLLLNDKPAKKIIFSKIKKAIGYEMEGTSAIEACLQNNKSEFIIVKGVSDLGDGTKDKEKDKRQEIAAANAVSLCHYVFSNAVFDEPEDNKKPEETNLPSSNFTSNIEIIGRERDIETIHNAFEKANIIALHGEGGIGKTVTAELYAEKYRGDYKTINHLQFSDSVQNTLMSLMDEWELKGYDGMPYDDKWNIIKNKLINLTYKILIIIHINDESITKLSDNVNLKYGKNVQFLFTTRVKNLPPCKMIEVEPLSDDEIKQIFINNACDKKDRAIIEKEIAEHSAEFNEIIKIYRKNTMLITLAARIKNAANKSIIELCELINNDPLVRKEGTSVEMTKDNEMPDIFPIKEHIKKLYSIANLSEVQIDFLRNMSLMDYGGVPLEKFNEWMELDNNNTEVSLENNGFIHYEFNSDGKKIIYMHPAVSDAVFEQTGASSETCEKMLINLFLKENDQNSLYKKRYLLPIVEFILKKIDDDLLLLVYESLAGMLSDVFGDIENSFKHLSNLIIIAKKSKAFENFDGVFNDNDLNLSFNETIINTMGSRIDLINNMTKSKGFDFLTNKNNSPLIFFDETEKNNLLDFYQKFFYECKELFGGNNIAKAYFHITAGLIHKDHGDYPEAKRNIEKAIIIYESSLGYKHPKTAKAYCELGLIYSAIKRPDLACRYYKKALNIINKVIGEDNQFIEFLYTNIALSLYEMGNFRGSAKYKAKAEAAEKARETLSN
jgi:nucleoside phosphorylase/tetratricopeptide (TPR) repeat protein